MERDLRRDDGDGRDGPPKRTTAWVRTGASRGSEPTPPAREPSTPAPAPRPAYDTAAYPPPSPGQPDRATVPPQGWGSYPRRVPEAASNDGRPWTIAGFVCGLAALLVAPIILGPLGITFGFIGKSKGDRRGLWVGLGSIVTMIVGIVIGVALTLAVHRD